MSVLYAAHKADLEKFIVWDGENLKEIQELINNINSIHILESETIIFIDNDEVHVGDYILIRDGNYFIFTPEKFNGLFIVVD